MIDFKHKILVAAIFLILHAFSGARPATAQSIVERLVPPPASLTGSSNPFLISLNPAAMAMTRSWEIEYFHTELKSQDVLAGTGDAVYATSPVFGPLYLGFGFENVRPSDEWSDAWLTGHSSMGSWSMLTFAMAFRLGEMASIGGDIRKYKSDTNPRFDGITTWDLAVHLHPSPYMSLMVSVHDISTPRLPFPDDSIERTWGAGVAVRPLGRDFLTISVDNLFGEVSRNDVLRTYLEIKPVRGLAIQGLMEMWFGDEGFMDDSRQFAFQASVGLRLDFPHAGVFGAVHMANRTGSPYLGFTLGARLSGQKYASMAAGHTYLMVPLKGSVGGEDAVALMLYLDAAAKEPAIRGVILDVDGFRAGPGTVQDIIDAVKRIKGMGKKVLCYSEGVASGGGLGVCSHTDEFYLGPAGGTDFSGSKMRMFYFTGLLEKLGVNAQIFRIGDYKSYPEMLTLKGPSEKSTEAHRELLEETFQNIAADIAEGRKFEKGAEQAAEVIAGGPYNALEMVDENLADGVIFRDQIKAAIEKKTGKKINLAQKFDFSKKAPDKWMDGRKIGVVVISGTMVEGRTRTVPLLGYELAGAETLVPILEKARTCPSIAALVLRVDSGGGSAFASEKIWRAVQRVAEQKPVIASFGSAAASGGYYASVAAHEIWAQPSTVTGSIGLFAGKADLTGLLGKLGISVTLWKEGGERADMESWLRPYTGDEIKFIKKQVTHFYNLFLDRVAEGRKMKKADIHAVAQGRVWSGRKAKELGLVDKNGGFLDAVDRARKLAKLPSWAPVVSLTKKKKSLLMRLLGSSFSLDTKSEQLVEAIEEAAGKTETAKIVSPLIMTLDNEKPLAMADYVILWD
ncbi:MAG: signal peptide peptidase SppA [Pseudomonadota bacterium]